MKALYWILLLVTVLPRAHANDGRVALQRELDRLYAGEKLPPEAYDDSGGYAAACVVLGRVVAHMRDDGAAVSARNLTLLSWALLLMRFDPTPEEPPFVRALIHQHINALIEHYQKTPRFNELVVMLADAARAWSPRHLPFLARRAGQGSLEERIWNVERARSVSPWPEEDARRMARELRAIPTGRRTAEQWGLIGLSGQARVTELVKVLALGAESFSNAEGESRLLDADHSIRQALDELVERFDADDARAVQAVERARALFAGERDAWRRDEIALFFEAIHNDTQLEAPLTPAVPVDPGAGEYVKAMRTQSKYRHVGNVAYPFAREPNTTPEPSCEDSILGPLPGE